jgi:3-dehydroquinate dehydratase-2
MQPMPRRVAILRREGAAAREKETPMADETTTGRRRKVLFIQGANMVFLGRREPERYGTTTAAEVDAMMRAHAAERGVEIEIFYSNVEGHAIDRIFAAADQGFDGILMNPAGFQYAGYALRDCLFGVKPGLPYVEVHMTKHSIAGTLKTVTADACDGFIAGFGTDSYPLGLDALLRIIARRAGA